MSRADLISPSAAGARLVIFRLGVHRIALSLYIVERIVRAVAVTALPNAPAPVLGVIDLAGEVLPVFDLRRRLNLPQRPITPADHLVITRTARRRAALVVDHAEGVIERYDEDIITPESVVAEVDGIHGLIRLDGQIAFIHDLDRFLSPDDADALDASLNAKVGVEVRAR